MDISNYQTHFRNLFNSTIQISSIDFHELPNLIARTMEAVNQYKDLNGENKHALVIEVLTTAIENTNVSNSKKAVTLNQLNNLIENFIDVSKGSVNVNKKEMVDPKSNNLIKIGEDVYNEVKQLFTNGKITMDKLVKKLPFVVTSVIKVLNKIKKLKGNEKKQIAIAVINRIIDELPISDQALAKLYKKNASNLINTTIDIASGKININQIANVGFNLCKLFCK